MKLRSLVLGALIAFVALIPTANAYIWHACENPPTTLDVYFYNQEASGDCTQSTGEFETIAWAICYHGRLNTAVSELSQVYGTYAAILDQGWFFYWITGNNNCGGYTFDEIANQLMPAAYLMWTSEAAHAEDIRLEYYLW